MKPGDKVYCHTTHENRDFKKGNFYEIINISPYEIIIDDGFLWCIFVIGNFNRAVQSSEMFALYFVTLRELRQMKLQQLNESRR